MEVDRRQTSGSPTLREQNLTGDMQARLSFAIATLNSSLLVLQLALVLSGLVAFLRASKYQRKGRGKFIIASLAILVTSSTDIILGLVETFGNLYRGGTTGSAYKKYLGTYDRGRNILFVAGDTGLTTTIILGDGLLLWRCWILWASKLYLLIPSILAFLGTLAASLAYLAWAASEENKGKEARAAVMSSMACSASLNLMVTFLILLRLNITRKQLAMAFHEKRDPRFYSSVAATLIESTSPLTFFAIISVVLRGISTFHPPKDVIKREELRVTVTIIGWFYAAFCALSPQMIIHRVLSGVSWRNAKESEREETISRGLSFAQPASASDNSPSATVKSCSETA